MEYYTYFEIGNSKNYRMWNSLTNDVFTVERLSNNKNQFYLPSKLGYESTDEDLIKFGQELKKDADELALDPIFAASKNSFHYIQEFQFKNGDKFYRSHNRNVMSFFNLFSPKAIVESFENYSLTEVKYYEDCYNGSLQFCEPGTYQSYGYDYSNQYGRCLAAKHFEFPMSQGTEKYISKLPNKNKIEFGIYRVIITSNDPNIRKVFSFSKKHTYTHTDIIHAINLKEIGFEINIDLRTDLDKNCLIYTKNQLIDGDKVFGKWCKTITDLKKKYPKNMLLKFLGSSLWGHLSEFNEKRIDKSEIDNYSMDWEDNEDVEWIIQDKHYKKDGSFFYTVVNRLQPYKTNFRLKPFITSFCRMKIATTALLDIDNVIRIHTDNVTLKEPLDLDMASKYLLPEKKTTGLICWRSVNDYEKL